MEEFLQSSGAFRGNTVIDSAAGTRPAVDSTEGDHPCWVILQETKRRLKIAPAYREETGMPFVTVSYAQSIDGSIASAKREPLPLSSSESLILTHALRAANDSVLVGIGCVIADNPRLTVRLTAGKNPQPIIVDGSLRCPLSINLLHNEGLAPWIAATDQADRGRQRLLEQAGAKVIRARQIRSRYVDLRALLHILSDLGISSVMVEGGSKIITSFLSEHLANQIVITMAPLFVGGLKAINTSRRSLPACLPRLAHICYEKVGGDLILRGDPIWTGT